MALTKKMSGSVGFLGLLVMAATLFSVGAGGAADFFVRKDGDDARDGRTRGTAFATIQRGVDALSPGDTLSIGPGEYRESVERADLGSGDKETLIRAEIPGTVVLRGDVPAPVFRKLEGSQDIYVADFRGDVQAVNEVDTAKRFAPAAPGIADLEFAPGQYHYDAAKGRLYVSTSDFRPAGEHVYTISVNPRCGIHLLRPRRVILDGLAAAGFNSGAAKALKAETQQGANWGFWLNDARGCVVRNCTAFLNAGGIGLTNQRNGQGGGNIIERCVVYSNGSPFVIAGGIFVYFPNDDVIRDCQAFDTDRFAFRFYHAGNGTALMERNVALSGEVALKGDGSPERARARACVGLQNVDAPALERSILGAGNRREAGLRDPKTIFLSEEGDLAAEDRDFADAENGDFRLQASSRFRGKDGADRGPFPYEDTIRYVSPSGDDAADGTSMKSAWKSLGRAAASLKAGDTLYVAAGRYDGGLVLSSSGTPEQPIAVRGRGNGRVVIAGDVRIQGGHNLALDRLTFEGAVSVQGGGDVAFGHCVFDGRECGLMVDDAGGLRVVHGIFRRFAKSGIALRRCSGVFLSGNFFGNSQAPAVVLDDASSILYSGFNGYAALENAWRVGGRAAMPMEEHSEVLDGVWKDGDGWIPAGPAIFAGRGPLGRALGPCALEREKRLLLSGPQVHSVSATTANLEWKTTAPAVCEVAWGTTPDCPNTATVNTNHFGTFSLTDLKPGTTHYFRILGVRTPDELFATQSARPGGIPAEPVAFTTLAKDAEPRTYFVRTDGNDARSGLDPAGAWRTINHAASRVNAGDTVLIGNGEYAEKVFVRATGTKNAPIRFQAEPGAKVTLTGAGKRLNAIFVIHGKNAIAVDGLYFKDLNAIGGSQVTPFLQAAVFNVIGSRGVSITRCLYDGRGEGYSPPFLAASEAPDLLVKNCAIVAPMHGLYVSRCPGFRLENNVFLRCQIGTLHAGNPANTRISVRRNVFTDSLAHKPNASVVEFPPGAEEGDNCYFLRKGGQREAFSLSEAEGGDSGGALTYQELAAILKPSSPSLVRNPSLHIVRDLTAEQTARIQELNERPANKVKDRTYYAVDLLADNDGPALDFADLFVTEPEAVKRGIGLQPEAFAPSKE